MIVKIVINYNIHVFFSTGFVSFVAISQNLIKKMEPGRKLFYADTHLSRDARQTFHKYIKILFCSIPNITR